MKLQESKWVMVLAAAAPVIAHFFEWDLPWLVYAVATVYVYLLLDGKYVHVDEQRRELPRVGQPEQPFRDMGRTVWDVNDQGDPYSRPTYQQPQQPRRI